MTGNQEKSCPIFTTTTIFLFIIIGWVGDIIKRSVLQHGDCHLFVISADPAVVKDPGAGASRKVDSPRWR